MAIFTIDHSARIPLGTLTMASTHSKDITTRLPFDRLVHRLTECITTTAQQSSQSKRSRMSQRTDSRRTQLYATVASMPRIRSICEIDCNAGHGASLWLLANRNATVYNYDRRIGGSTRTMSPPRSSSSIGIGASQCRCRKCCRPIDRRKRVVTQYRQIARHQRVVRHSYSGR